MSVEIVPIKEKKKRIRKPQPTPVQQVIKLLTAMNLHDQRQVYAELKTMLNERRTEMTEALKTLEGL